jgi:hypothetical protein
LVQQNLTRRYDIAVTAVDRRSHSQ